MRSILNCRRSLVSIFAIACLTAIALDKGIDSSMAIATVAVGLAGANSAENFMSRKNAPKQQDNSVPPPPPPRG